MIDKAIKFSSKANNLENIGTYIQKACLLPQYEINYKQWREAKGKLKNLKAIPCWFSEEVIVRSSAVNEDQLQHSMAGRYLSVPNLIKDSLIEQGIANVFSSYLNENPNNQVLIQPMVKNIKVSGVAVNHEPNGYFPYSLINYDDTTGKSNTITQGRTNQLKLLVVSPHGCKKITGWKKKVIDLLDELESLFAYPALDIEFVINSSDELILLQVRPLLNPGKRTVKKQHSLKQLNRALTNLKSKFSQVNCKAPAGLDDTILGIMPDWNPAEIIGIRPTPLSLSLYQTLISNNVCAAHRYKYGYKNAASSPMIVSMLGMPYVDVRNSFYSLIPNSIELDLAHKLTNFYLRELKKHPEWHDKVEFNILISSDHFDISSEVERLLMHGFDENECRSIQKSVNTLTLEIINPIKGHWYEDVKNHKDVLFQHALIMESQVDLKKKISQLIALCQQHVAKVFVGLARTAFIAVKFLKSLVKVDVLSQQDYHAFMQSLSTVSRKMINDLNVMEKSIFLERYGHVRPNMYDLLSPRYDEQPDLYFNWDNKEQRTSNKNFCLSQEQKKKLNHYLNKHTINYSAEGFIDFLKQAIELREQAKFDFSAVLSDVLLLIRQLGERVKLTPDDISLLDLSDILIIDDYAVINKRIEKAKKIKTVRDSLMLPALITSTEDLDCFSAMDNQPNFITLKHVIGNTLVLKDSYENLTGKIVFIESADPGYDWIFAHGISGLITMYGGCNSHMSIRAGELNLPAVIGAGEQLFSKWSNSDLLSVDCEKKLVRILR